MGGGRLGCSGSLTPQPGNLSRLLYRERAPDNDDSVIMICNASGESKVIEVEFANEQQGTQFIMEELLLSESTDAVITKTEIFRGNIMIPVINLPSKSVVELKILRKEWTEAQMSKIHDYLTSK